MKINDNEKKRRFPKSENLGFVIHQNYEKYFDTLDANQTKQLIKFLFKFMENKELEKIDDPILEIIYFFITDNIKIGNKRYLASVENGKKGGRPKKVPELNELYETSDKVSDEKEKQNLNELIDDLGIVYEREKNE